ncbi:Isochorismatase hydrolase [Lipomyces kononenkoae]|uniref:Isochorismatase hydrolase n=1 Tax=Lipomyces kononenkoae TaxID=34357 RepID=A0ACC3T8L6_LIPKO
MAPTEQSVASTVNFGQHYAVLNLDMMSILMDAIRDTTEGQVFISNCSRWNYAVHQKRCRPLTIFTSLAFNPSQPELDSKSTFAKLIAPFGTFEKGSSGVQIDPGFAVDEKDFVLHKTRLSATTGNSLEQILNSRGIDTVVISGLSISGVVMSTIYRLFDLDYNIYVISDNVLELPVNETAAFWKVMLDTLLPKMSLTAISLDEALQALERS